MLTTFSSAPTPAGGTSARQTSASTAYVMSTALAGEGYVVPSRGANGSDAGAFDFEPDSRPAQRSVLLRNHIVGGLLLHQTRAPPPQRQQAVSAAIAAGSLVEQLERDRVAADRRACEGRFAPFSLACRPAGLDSAPFGRDPVFMPGSPLFRPSANASQYFNTSRGSAEVNPNGLPFAFFHLPLQGYPIGYPIFLDIDATEARAFDTVQYLADGGFLDESTLSLTVDAVAYNADTLALYYSRAELRFTGTAVEAACSTLPVALLAPAGGNPRLAAWCGVNAGLTALVLGQLAQEVARFAALAREPARWRRQRPPSASGRSSSSGTSSSRAPRWPSSGRRCSRAPWRSPRQTTSPSTTASPPKPGTRARPPRRSRPLSPG